MFSSFTFYSIERITKPEFYSSLHDANLQRRYQGRDFTFPEEK